MKLINVSFVLTLLILLFEITYGCLSNKYSSKEILLLGNELDEYADISTYIQIDEFSSKEILNLSFNNNLKLYNIDRLIKIEIFSSIDSNFSLADVQKTFERVMILAIEHLNDHFVGMVVGKNLYFKILVCCIEYGMRFQNYKYINVAEDQNCVDVLGLSGSKKNKDWIINNWVEDMVLEIVI